MQIDDAIARISIVLGKAKNIRNCFAAPVNRLPPEMLAHIATFFARERDLIDATAVCHHWRTTLLSFPLLWCNVGGSPPEIRAYIERSKSAMLDVSLLRPSMAELVAPHTSRMASLTVELGGSLGLSQITEHLHYPIPTLHTFRMVNVLPHVHTLIFPPNFNPFFLHSKKLEIAGISAFRGQQTFPCVTELTLRTNDYEPRPLDSFLGILERLPLLEMVHITFAEDMYIDSIPRVATLPRVQTMTLSRLGKARAAIHFPWILGYLRLPNLTSLRVQASRGLVTYRPIFPQTEFDEHLPNFTELPELHVDMESAEATFRNPSRATLKYHIGPLEDYESNEGKLWRELPLHSVRGLAVNVATCPFEQEFGWLNRLLGDLVRLEHLELWAEYGGAIRWLCQELERKKNFLRVESLTVHCREHERPQALKLKQLADAVGLITTLVFTPNPGGQDE